jgi:peptide chain release factor 1
LRRAAGGMRRACSRRSCFRAYERYAALRGWQFRRLSPSYSDNGLGGYKECVANVTGRVFAR